MFVSSDDAFIAHMLGKSASAGCSCTLMACQHDNICQEADASSLLIFVRALCGFRRARHAGQSRCSKAASLEILDLSEGEALELLCRRNIPSKAAVEVIPMGLFHHQSAVFCIRGLLNSCQQPWWQAQGTMTSRMLGFACRL